MYHFLLAVIGVIAIAFWASIRIMGMIKGFIKDVKPKNIIEAVTSRDVLLWTIMGSVLSMVLYAIWYHVIVYLVIESVFEYKEVIPEYLDESATFYCLEIFFLICLTLVSLSVFRSHFILEKKKVKDYNK